ncbi:T cell receptor alpha chain MC.7.G5-like isoform X2 [Lates japonicus]|nr:T cell receptor alpha chain MC.7.G5-like isoform X2 [Lates japonicus]
MVFGSGINLIVIEMDQYLPSYYELKNDTTKVCLATGYSEQNKTEEHDLFNDKNITNRAVRIEGDSLFNNVVFLEDGDNKTCEQKTKPEEETPCVDMVEKDPTVNAMALTMLVLRLIFIKTIVFNLLMTLRLWISHSDRTLRASP